MHGIFDVWGIYNPLVLADYHRYWEGLGSRSTPLYDFLNAKYIVGHKDVVLDWEKFELAFDADPSVNIYRNTQVLPRALIVHEAWSVPDHQQAFDLIHREDFDPATTVVVENGESLTDDRAGAAEVQIRSFSNNAINLVASTSEPGYLVMSEVYYPGWRVEVDGKREEITRANYAFRAVFLSPGTHEVSFSFQPTTWRVGLLLSISTWSALCLAALSRLRHMTWSRPRAP
jgi:hypothetical protein